MKFSYIIAIIVLFVCINGSVAYGQSTTNSKSQFNKNTMIQLKLHKAQECIDKGNYTGAKNYLNGVLKLDNNNVKAKQLLATCNKGSKSVQTVSTTLNVSKLSLSFTASGGSENISITTYSNSYSIALLPTWCSVQKYSGYFVVTCNQLTGSTTRNDYFTVSVGEKSVQIYINQKGVSNSEAISSNKKAITLSVSKDYIYFEKKGGKSESIKVSSSTGSYSISMIPSWCSVQTHNGYFTVTCNANNNSQKLSNWLYVIAGDKNIKVNINQNGSTAINTSDKSKKPKSTNLYLNVGIFKPMVFKDDGKTFANNEFGYSFTVGLVKTLGLYAKINTNFSSNVGDYAPLYVPNTYYTKSNIVSNSTFSRFGIVGGLMLNINPIMLYIGAGKGHYYHYIKTDLYKYSDDNFAKTINLTTISHSGLETDAGLIINFNRVGLSLGVSSIEFKYMELNLGLGIRL